MPTPIHDAHVDREGWLQDQIQFGHIGQFFLTGHHRSNDGRGQRWQFRQFSITERQHVVHQKSTAAWEVIVIILEIGRKRIGEIDHDVGAAF